MFQSEREDLLKADCGVYNGLIKVAVCLILSLQDMYILLERMDDKSYFPNKQKQSTYWSIGFVGFMKCNNFDFVYLAVQQQPIRLL